MSELRYLEKHEREGKMVIPASGLITMMKSPKHFHSKYILNEQEEESDAREDGKLIHLAYYENEKFVEKYQVLDDKANYITTADEIKKLLAEANVKPKGKKEDLINQLLEVNPTAKVWERYLAEMAKNGKQLLEAEQHRKCLKVIEGINGHWWLSKLPTEKRQTEVAGYYKHKSGVIISFRLDDLRFAKNGRPIILDLKKTKDASPEAFARDIWNYKLFVQAAIYHDAIQDIFGLPPLYAWVAVEFAAPYCVEVYAADEGMLSAGHNVYNKQINRYLECMETGEWPSYGNGKVNSIALPHWAYSKLDEYAEGELEAAI
jgi:hypothetical protein